MVEANETIADIAAEKREMAAKIRAELSQVPARREDQLLEADSLEREADRLEAAAKREREQHKRELDRAVLNKDFVDSIKFCAEMEKRYNVQSGNAASMREAFKELDKELSFCERNVELGIGFALEGLREHCRIVREILNTALSAPPRNCDRDLSDRQAVWSELKDWIRCSTMGCCSEPTAYDVFDWLLAPAAERKGEGDGSK